MLGYGYVLYVNALEICDLDLLSDWREIQAISHDFMKIKLNLNLPSCNCKCNRWYKQTFILLKIHAKMVAKW